MKISPILEEDFKQIASFLPDKQSLLRTRWLITGFTGMICSYFLSFLCWLNETELEKSLKITAIHRANLSMDDPVISHLLDNECITFLQMDLGKEFTFPLDDNFDYVIHGATSAAPRGYLADPVSTINVNVFATRVILEHFRKSTRLKALLYMSSGEIYGNPDISHVPTPENYLGITDHLSTRSCYVESKRFTETLCANYFYQYRVPVRMIRPVQLFGPGFRGDDSRAWVDFITKVIRNQPIEILSDGSSRRGYCYLADAVTQIMAVLQKGKDGAVYNIGNEEHISIKELADMISTFRNPPVPVVVQKNPPAYLQGSPQISCPSVSKVSDLEKQLRTNIITG